ncbi:MTDH isoform 5, partial [Pan troglodytes]
TNGKDWGRSWSDRSIFSGIGSTAEPVSQSTTSDYQWDVSRNQPYIDDEWSGLNGLSSADPNSDWNAPAEEWGNWVDEERASLLKSQEPIPDDQKVSDDDKEKGEGALPTGKSKKKKKKKKKQGEDNSTAQPIKTLPPATSTEPSVILSKSDSDKSSSQVPPILQETDKSKSNTKQNSVPPSQTKSETS